MEVEASYSIKNGLSFSEAECSSMNDEAWDAFMERLERHERNQTSACEI